MGSSRRVIREPVIVGAVRTPVGKRGGALAAWHPADLLGQTLSELMARAGIDSSHIDDVIAGSVMTHDQSSNIGRHAVLSAGLSESVPAVTVDRQCGSGQQAVTFAAHGVVAGSYDLAIACGVESMSQMPLPASLKPGAPLGPQYSPRELARYNGGLLVQGPSSELMNTRFELTRAELDKSNTNSTYPTTNSTSTEAPWRSATRSDRPVPACSPICSASSNATANDTDYKLYVKPTAPPTPPSSRESNSPSNSPHRLPDRAVDPVVTNDVCRSRTRG